MSTSTTTVQPAERQDIHKSCRTIETLVNVLHEYCDAASAFTSTQKKLARALKDAASLKTSTEYAANALGASASIFDILADVDGKFAKLADKECTSLGAEIKKWFKKLAKEEKAHDDRMNESNARIKQAGQSYEKKSKKGARDAGEEHARYINLLSVLGPEMSQEKYNHAVFVTQQHTSTTFSVAASFARIADAEWSRACESMRRFSPTIGPLGEWRALCEASWNGPLPNDLPGVSPTQAQPNPQMGQLSSFGVSEWGQTGFSATSHRSLPMPPTTGHNLATPTAAETASLDMPQPPYTASDQNQGSINSITTLSAFPFPPTHFPVPLAMNEAELQRQQMQLQSLQVAQTQTKIPDQSQPQSVQFQPGHVMSNSPKPIESSLSPDDMAPTLTNVAKSPVSSPVLAASHQVHHDVPADKVGLAVLASTPKSREPDSCAILSGDPQKHRRPSLKARAPSALDKPFRPDSPFRRAEQPSTEKEFGVQKDLSRSAFKSHSVDAAKKTLERSESTTSTGSNVAALRHKYSRTIDHTSQGPKDIPRLPMSVSEIASRYQPQDEPMSPRRVTASPVHDRFPLCLDTPSRQATRDAPPEDDEIRRRKQRIEELAELELKEKEYELRQRERELNQRSRDLERDKLQFLNVRPDLNNVHNASDGPKGPRNSPFHHKRGSQSASHLIPPSTTTSAMSPQIPRPRSSHSPSRSQPSTPLPSKDHAPFCGCGTCSVSKYKFAGVAPSPRDLRPPEPPILLRPEKPKGWIRRLSMPSVSGAFSLDAKKNASTTSLKAGLQLPAELGRLRKRSWEQGISSRDVAGIGR
ncbi:hypothetical protein F5I97DRAFT_1889711 [Phlebopus sp. FC_14]|nr:hypothetical protein F5I97DRAFT_1889711 [Phlebopus sp. FC_14]